MTLGHNSLPIQALPKSTACRPKHEQQQDLSKLYQTHPTPLTDWKKWSGFLRLPSGASKQWPFPLTTPLETIVEYYIDLLLSWVFHSEDVIHHHFKSVHRQHLDKGAGRDLPSFQSSETEIVCSAGEPTSRSVSGGVSATEAAEAAEATEFETSSDFTKSSNASADSRA